jgi:hypothetical protein
MPLKGLIATNCDIGYEFSGATEAMRMVDCGVEQFETIGVKLNGTYNIKFDSCYFESSNGIGVEATSSANISLDNCWIYGSLKMFSGFNDNTNVRINNNNVIGGGAIWWDINDGSEYNLSDIRLQNKPAEANKVVDRVVAKNASNVEQAITLYNPATGLQSVLGRASQTSAFHPMKLNGAHTSGYTTGIVPGCAISTKPGSPSGSNILVHKTGITFSETQLLYINIKISYSGGTWNWQGICVNTTVLPIGIVSPGSPIIYNLDGFVAIDSPSLSGVVSSMGGEIRLV